MSTPDPKRVHEAMVFAFEERERRPEEEVRDLLFEKGYGAEEIMTALANLPSLPHGFQLPARPLSPLVPPPPAPPPPPLTQPKAAPAPPPKTEALPRPPASTPMPTPRPVSADPFAASDAPDPEFPHIYVPPTAPASKAKPVMQPLPPGTGKAAPKAARRGRPAQGAWIFSAVAGVIMLALILAFSCGRSAPEQAPAGSVPTVEPAPAPVTP